MRVCPLLRAGGIAVRHGLDWDIPMTQPGRDTAAHVGDLLDRVETPAELVDALRG